MYNLPTEVAQKFERIGGVGGTPLSQYSPTTAEGARQQLWNQFTSDVLPRISGIEEQIKQRRSDFIMEAEEGVNKAVALSRNTAAVGRESLGIALSPEEERAQERLLQLGGSSAQVSTQNEAVDIADEVNERQAGALLSIQTGLQQEALGELQGAASLKDARLAGDAQRKAQAKASNTATLASVAMIAAMMI